MTYGCQTRSLNKQLTNKLRTAQRAMERKMLDLGLQDKILCSEIRRRTKIIDITEYTMKQKWRWAGHTARMKDNRLTKRCTERQPRRGKRFKRTAKQKTARRHNKEGGNHLDQESNRQKTVEDIDGGLFPKVGEQSLGERRNSLTRLGKIA